MSKRVEPKSRRRSGASTPDGEASAEASQRKKLRNAGGAGSKEVIVANTPSIPARRSDDQLPELLVASAAGDLSAVENALEGGSDLSACSRGGYTALHLAAANGRQDVVGELLRARADPDSRTFFGQVPLHLAVLSGGGGDAQQSVVRQLIDARANPSARDKVSHHAQGWSVAELGRRCGARTSLLQAVEHAADEEPTLSSETHSQTRVAHRTAWANLLRSGEKK